MTLAGAAWHRAEQHLIHTIVSPGSLAKIHYCTALSLLAKPLYFYSHFGCVKEIKNITLLVIDISSYFLLKNNQKNLTKGRE